MSPTITLFDTFTFVKLPSPNEPVEVDEPLMFPAISKLPLPVIFPPSVKFVVAEPVISP